MTKLFHTKINMQWFGTTKMRKKKKKKTFRELAFLGVAILRLYI